MASLARSFADAVCKHTGTALIAGPEDLQEMNVNRLDGSVDLGSCGYAKIRIGRPMLTGAG